MLNPYTFPMLRYQQSGVQLPPEFAPRSGQGGWEAFSLAVPFDRLLPFVITRATSQDGITVDNPPWLNCVRVEHADTGELIRDLRPVGDDGSGTPLYGNDILFTKYPDPLNNQEHFIYFGGVVGGLNLPCGVPFRVVVDNFWQSPRFEAFYVPSQYMLVEWWQKGPANNVPYGTGFRHRLYVPNGAYQLADATEKREETQVSASGTTRLDYLAILRNAAFTVGPVPRYLAEALTAMPASDFLQVDGEPWRCTGTQRTPQGPDGGRWLCTVNIQDAVPLVLKAAIPAPALTPAVYDPVHGARRWRCGDTTDTAPDIESFEQCVIVDSVGYIHVFTVDRNPYSATYGDTTDTPTDERCA